MGVFDIFKNESTEGKQTILPTLARDEILAGRLPVLNTNRIFLMEGELCHFVEIASYEKRVLTRHYSQKTYNSSKDEENDQPMTYSYGGGLTNVIDTYESESIPGILYITNKRIIFQGDQEGLELSTASLTAIVCHPDFVKIQCGNDVYKFLVPDGVIVQSVLHCVSQARI